MALFIFPLANAAASLHGAMMNARHFRGHPMLASGVPTLEACRSIVWAIFDEQVNGRLLWANLDQEMLDKELSKHFPNWHEPAYIQPARDLYDRIIDPIYTEICMWVATAIPHRTWNIWYTKPIGRDLALEEGSDYRIVDWSENQSNRRR